MRRCLPFRIDSAQALVVEQVAKHGFYRALAHAAPVLPRPTLLALPGEQVGRIIGERTSFFCVVPAGQRYAFWSGS
jgi:hypothetical protein